MESRVECRRLLANHTISTPDVHAHTDHFAECRGGPLRRPDRRQRRLPGLRCKTVDQQSDISDAGAACVLSGALEFAGTVTTAAYKTTDSLPIVAS